MHLYYRMFHSQLLYGLPVYGATYSFEFYVLFEILCFIPSKGAFYELFRLKESFIPSKEHFMLALNFMFYSVITDEPYNSAIEA